MVHDPVALAKVKAQAPKPSTEDEPMDEDEVIASSSHEDDPDEGEDEVDPDEDLEEEEGTASTKLVPTSVESCNEPHEYPCSAEAALSRTQDVDIPGGWKNGDPCVCRCCVVLALYVFTFTCRVPYAALAKVFSLIEATTKRIEKTSLLTSFLLLVIRRRAKGDTESLLQAVYLCINRVRTCPHCLFLRALLNRK